MHALCKNDASDHLDHIYTNPEKFFNGLPGEYIFIFIGSQWKCKVFEKDNV